mmetsp:Transcript_76136/g.181162  ORF Transcript_76136/g.181162 Transcript_76136/m.181162 type:complete len:379 (-) Transcript_76136:310-1446(-)|eukprot:CAMPEP_0178403322 /NCGR_PEP_ID=MMETSP0689_2-20121128/17307_1 /TAXON_ID=160604 /ORGANISM="Amphidinium massartii, Strain CS-259" /LENGTH=378 /DNA_ID=CAMNT_0020024269 /DNA_START=85 /DNA_END=1221 /DNA_ORIENTATION=-
MMATYGSAVNELRAARIEEVATASRDTLAGSILNSSQATASFRVQRASPLSNTFLNFVEAAPTGFRRAVSFDLGCLDDSTADEGSPMVSSAASNSSTTPTSFLEVPAGLPLQATSQSPRWCDWMKKGDESDDLDSFGEGSTYVDSAMPSVAHSRRSSLGSVSSMSSAACSSQDPFAMAILSRVQEMQPCCSSDSDSQSRGEEVVEYDARATLSTPKVVLSTMPLEAAVTQFPLVHHMVQQEQEDSQEAAAPIVESEGEGITTVMLQNLPRIFIKQDLLDALDANGFVNEYDYVHVSYSFASGVCHGYAFINFTTAEAAQAFMDTWSGSTRFCQRKHKKPLLVTVATVQGLSALLAQPSMKKLLKVKNPAFRPFMRCVL